MFRCPDCQRPARVLYVRYVTHCNRCFSCRRCAGIIYQSTMGHRWDRSARRVEKLRAQLLWGAGGTMPIKPRGMHQKTYERILGMLAYHEAVRNQGASYARKSAPERERKKVEMCFAQMKRIFELDRLRLRGLSGAKDEVLLTAIAQNLRRLVKLY